MPARCSPTAFTRWSAAIAEAMRRGLEQAQTVIVLTDGYLGGDWGVWNHPVLWCIVNGSSEIPPNGKYARVDR